MEEQRPEAFMSIKPTKDTMAAHSSLAAMFMARVRATPDARAFQFPDGDGWTWLTWKQTAERVRAIAMGLKSLGVESEQRCAILATTRMDWVLADLGVMCAGGATTTVYPANTADECAYIVRDSETRYIFAEDNEQVAKLVEKRAELGNVEKVITFDGDAGHDGWVITLSDLEELGNELDAENATLFDDTLDTIKPDHLATLIYTSGTTGIPKGVELTHDCWVFEGEAVEAINILKAEDHQYLWLPLSHSFGKVLEVLQLHIGFSTTIDGRVDKLVENLGIVRPTFMAAAPRIFEKVYNKVVSGVQMGSPIKQKVFGWSTGVGRRVSALRQRGKQPSGLLAIKYAIANKLVFSKLKNRFGGKIRFFVSGSAPLSQELAEFFHAADILILEGYGLTESSAASCINRLEQFAFGSVGPALPGVEIKLAEEDNEIWLKGRGIMRGYHNKPDDTAACLEDGWLKTGDIGELGEDGLLRVTVCHSWMSYAGCGFVAANVRLASELESRKRRRTCASPSTRACGATRLGTLHRLLHTFASDLARPQGRPASRGTGPSAPEFSNAMSRLCEPPADREIVSRIS